ncbi:hypothetical protein Val02_22240 [Virgisporangium aliadipatigenens]|uniref:MmpS family membrane protein n=1 Tax=Virgisporangium aliadipatigenens TaxID=741659 RepID=A0A8J3YK61_9ACTN|nr:MmpS family transport accessory protein [Virgisporangium aliadipatigenens]GIJ45338.1 hypothetical protein Val02_22240 [Virgisporangium aliadipatigenens]
MNRTYRRIILPAVAATAAALVITAAAAATARVPADAATAPRALPSDDVSASASESASASASASASRSASASASRSAASASPTASPTDWEWPVPTDLPTFPLPTLTPSAAPSSVPSGEAVIVYEVEGDGRAKIQYTDPESQVKEEADVVLPWRIQFPREGVLMQVMARRLSTEDGSVSCTIKRMDTVETTSTANGPQARVGCVLT